MTLDEILEGSNNQIVGVNALSFGSITQVFTGIATGNVGTTATGAGALLDSITCTSFDCRYKKVESTLTDAQIKEHMPSIVEIFNSLGYNVLKDPAILKHEVIAKIVRLTYEKKTLQQWKDMLVDWIKRNPNLYTHLIGKATTQLPVYVPTGNTTVPVVTIPNATPPDEYIQPVVVQGRTDEGNGKMWLILIAAFILLGGAKMLKL